MKTLINFGAILSIAILASCATSNNGTASQYEDDIYYSPKNDRIKVAEKDVNQDIRSYRSPDYSDQSNDRYNDNQTQTDNRNHDYYQKEYAEERTNNNQTTQQSTVNPSYSNASYSSDDYYDYEYAARLRRFHSPYVGAGYYDDFYTNRYYYDRTPAYYGASIYGGSSIYGGYPYSGMSIGYSSLTGWNSAVHFGFGWTWGGGYGYPYYSPFYNPYYGAFHYPYYHYGYYSPFNYGYYNGYRHGYRNGFYDGYYGNNDYYGSRNRTIYGPRGASGSSTNYRQTSTSRPAKGNSENGSTGREAVNAPTTTETPTSRPTRTESRPVQNTATPNERPESIRPTRPSTPGNPVENTTRPTPEQYKPKTRENYYTPTKPSNVNEVPRRNANPEIKPSTRPTETRPTYVRPDRNNSYNRPQNTQPRSNPNIGRPSNPSRIQSQPSYNRSNSYSMPSRSNSGGGSPSRSSRPSR